MQPRINRSVAMNLSVSKVGICASCLAVLPWGWPAGRLLAPAWRALLVALALGWGTLGQSAAEAAHPLQCTLQREAGLIDVTYQGQRLLRYAFATNQFKPYVKELYTLKGDNVLLDAPPDHLHHHGLMYAVRVNGINFWEEAKDPGVQKPIGAPVCEILPGDGPPRARISHTIHWVASKDRWLTNTTPAALLIERRDLTLTVSEPQQEVALQWQASFELGPATPKVTLTGATYHGLGLRLPRVWDHVAKHGNSAGLPYSAEQKGDVTPAQWSVISHTVDGRDILVAVFSRGSNAGKAKFFTMLDAFAYVSATQDLADVPLEYAAGEQFRLDYLVLVYPSHKSREFLQQRYEQ